MRKRSDKVEQSDGKAKPSLLEEFEAPSEPTDPAIMEIVERMVEMRRQRLADRRARLPRKPPA